MRSLIITILGIFLGGLLLYYFTLERPELIYTLSDPIRLLPEEKDSNVGVQQLEVKNVGNSVANKIRVFIASPVISYEMVKYSKTDDVTINQSRDSLELNYPSLPPMASFKLTIKSDGIWKTSLSINHLGGTAKDATAISQWKSTDFLFLLLMVPVILTSVYFLYASQLGIWESRTNYEYETILKRRKPIYINSLKWESLRKKSMDYMIERDERTFYYSDKIQNAVALKLLSNQKPEYFSDEEWDYIVIKATKSTENIISHHATLAYD